MRGAPVLQQHGRRVTEVLARFAIDDDPARAVGGEIDNGNRVPARRRGGARGRLLRDGGAGSNRIVVTPGQIEAMSVQFARTWQGRRPTRS